MFSANVSLFFEMTSGIDSFAMSPVTVRPFYDQFAYTRDWCQVAVSLGLMEPIWGSEVILADHYVLHLATQ
jgi:hypothetical protein